MPIVPTVRDFWGDPIVRPFRRGMNLPGRRKASDDGGFGRPPDSYPGIMKAFWLLPACRSDAGGVAGASGAVMTPRYTHKRDNAMNQVPTAHEGLPPITAGTLGRAVVTGAAGLVIWEIFARLVAPHWLGFTVVVALGAALVAPIRSCCLTYDCPKASSVVTVRGEVGS